MRKKHKEVTEYGVFARKVIPKRTQFGPIEGIVVKAEDPSIIPESPLSLELLLEMEEGDLRRMDVSNENFSNWMRFVRPAKSLKNQNLVLSQQGNSLIFTSIRIIYPRQELQVWYSAPYALQRHLPLLAPGSSTSDEDSTLRPCFDCDQEFKTAEELQKHVQVHGAEHDEKNFGAGRWKRGHPMIKRRAHSHLPALKKFKLGEKKSRYDSGKHPYECMTCGRTFPRLYSLERHLLVHTSGKKYSCTICELDFAHPYNRNRHIRKQHKTDLWSDNASKENENENSWLCSHCNLRFSSASILNLHTLAHAADNLEEAELMGMDIDDNESENDFIVFRKDIKCPQCTMKFCSKRDLIKHVSAHGRSDDECNDENNENRPKRMLRCYKCFKCYKVFSSSERLQRHSFIHSDKNVKPLQCNVCFKRFFNNSALGCHQKTHTLDRSFECPICKQTFKQILALKSHVHSHSKNGYYECPHCSKACDEYSLMRKHIRAFHCDRKHSCCCCGKVFQTMDKLRMHMLRHSDHREFLCANCGKQFKRKDKLKEHMKRMHSLEREQKGTTKPPRSPTRGKLPPKILVHHSDYERFIYKCHQCLVGFKRRGMLVNHLANRHPDITPDSVPELSLPILKATRDYYCQYCEKIYKSSSKRKAHILKNHPGAELPMSNRQKGGFTEIPGVPNPTFSQTVGSVTTNPHGCQWCHKQYASKAKLLQHQRKKHLALLPHSQQMPRPAVTKSPPYEPTHSDMLTLEQPHPHDDLQQDDVLMPSEPVEEDANLPDSAAITMIPAEYEIATSEADFNEAGIVIDASSLKRGVKAEFISSDLLSQAMSELGETLSDMRAEQYLKLLQNGSSNGVITLSDLSVTDPFYTPYTVR